MEDKIRTCKTCGQQYTIKSGWKALFRKPTFDDLLTLFIVMMIIVSAYAYKSDTKVCRETLSNLIAICAQYNGMNYFKNESWNRLNFTFNLTSLTSENGKAS